MLVYENGSKIFSNWTNDDRKDLNWRKLKQETIHAEMNRQSQKIFSLWAKGMDRQS